MSDPAASTALVATSDDVPGVEQFRRQPIIDTIDPRKLALIKAQIAPGCTDAEVGHFLELSAHYELDPFAREVWCAKSKKGRLLIMVGRDGLRRIAHRNRLVLDSDVIHEKDEFHVKRTDDGERTITHSYGHPLQRGKVIGAWAEVRERDGENKQKGYFLAELSEYMPDGEYDSPWRKQVSVMLQSAAERTALRQATPLGGLLAEGEDAVVSDNEQRTTVAIELPEVLQPLVDRAHALDPSRWRPNEIAASLPLPDDAGFPAAVAQVATELNDWLNDHEPAEQEPVDAEVVNEDGDLRSFLDARWRAERPEDREWRVEVEKLVRRREDLQAIADSGPDDPAALDEERGEIDAALDALGIPATWAPPEQASLGL